MKPLYILMVATLAMACSQNKERESEGSESTSKGIVNQVTAFAETTPMPQPTDEDAADDPAIFIEEQHGRHLIYGSDKKGGLGLYDLEGKEIEYYALGKINNVDIRQNLPFQDTLVSIIAGSDRTNNGIFVALLSAEGKLVESSITVLPSAIQGEVYGFCLGYSSVDSTVVAFVNSKQGELEMWQIGFTDSLSFTGQIMATTHMHAQTEGLVMDDAQNTLYLGVEEKGIWKFNLNDSSLTGQRIPNSGPEDNKHIVMDIEGIAIYATDSVKYLMASSQGNYTYAIFDLLEHDQYVTSFKIVDGTLDGVEETDGLEVTSHDLGNGLNKGILVVQDGFNRQDGEIQPQNFKYVDFGAVLDLIEGSKE